MKISFYNFDFSYVDSGDNKPLDTKAPIPLPRSPWAPMDFDGRAAYKGRKMAFRQVTPAPPSC